MKHTFSFKTLRAAGALVVLPLILSAAPAHAAKPMWLKRCEDLFNGRVRTKADPRTDFRSLLDRYRYAGQLVRHELIEIRKLPYVRELDRDMLGMDQTTLTGLGKRLRSRLAAHPQWLTSELHDEAVEALMLYEAFELDGHAEFSPVPQSLGQDPEPLHFTFVVRTFDELLREQVRHYRELGGRLYWKSSKLKSGYATDQDSYVYGRDSAALAQLGDGLRSLFEHTQLTADERELIEIALEDYARFEAAPPGALQPVPLEEEPAEEPPFP